MRQKIKGFSGFHPDSFTGAWGSKIWNFIWVMLGLLINIWLAVKVKITENANTVIFYVKRHVEKLFHPLTYPFISPPIINKFWGVVSRLCEMDIQKVNASFSVLFLVDSGDKCVMILEAYIVLKCNIIKYLFINDNNKRIIPAQLHK